MQADLSPEALVNAGGALLFVLAGLAIAVLGHGSRRSVLLAGLACTYGTTFFIQNVFPYDLDDSTPGILYVVAVVPAIAFAALLAGEFWLGLEGGPRKRILWLGGLMVLAFTLAIGTIEAEAARGRAILLPGLLGRLQAYPNLVIGGTLSLLAATLGLRAHAQSREARATLPQGRMAVSGYAALALSFGLWAGFGQMIGLKFAGLVASPVGAAAFLAIGISTTACIWPWARVNTTTLARFTFPALAATMLLGTLLSPIYLEHLGMFGLFGILRTMGVAFLALAVLKYDLLGVPLPRLAVKRGTLAMGALAALFIVAQVAQNFFAAEYGLIMGGIVAGAVVFAASPIQRAIEAKSQRLPTPTAAPSVPTLANERREEDFRNAVRLALRDRRISVEEERLLFRLAESLGVGAGRAHEIRHEVESGMPRRRR